LHKRVLLKRLEAMKKNRLAYARVSTGHKVQDPINHSMIAAVQPLREALEVTLSVHGGRG
jgi:hypothetical protein